MAQRQMQVKVRPQRRGGPDDNEADINFSVGSTISRQVSTNAEAMLSAIDRRLAANQAA